MSRNVKTNLSQQDKEKIEIVFEHIISKFLPEIDGKKKQKKFDEACRALTGQKFHSKKAGRNKTNNEFKEDLAIDKLLSSGNLKVTAADAKKYIAETNKPDKHIKAIKEEIEKLNSKDSHSIDEKLKLRNLNGELAGKEQKLFELAKEELKKDFKRNKTKYKIIAALIILRSEKKNSQKGALGQFFDEQRVKEEYSLEFLKEVLTIAF